MTTGMTHEQNMEKQIDRHMGGCMAGFFHLFDRSHVLSGKRLYPKRLPLSIGVESASGTVSSVGSPAFSREFERPKLQEPTPAAHLPATLPEASPRSPVKEGLKSPWKFARDAPRLSLDSRLHPRGIRTTPAATTGGGRRDCRVGSIEDDESGSETQRRSPSVVARLMGLEPLPSSLPAAGNVPEKKAELRRSASESRSRDLLHCRFMDGNLPYQPSPVSTTSNIRGYNNGGRDLSYSNADNFNTSGRLVNREAFDHGGYIARNANPEPPLKPRRMIGQQQLRKGSYDFGDFFPEPKPTATSIYGDIEKRLKMRGIDEPSKDLETLKHILEALQLKGLLHSKTPSQIGRRSFGRERMFSYEESQSPIVVMKPARSPRRLALEPSPPRLQSKVGLRRNLSVTSGDSSPRRSSKTPMRNINPSSPGRSENRSVSPASPATARRKAALNIETRKTANETTKPELRRVSPVQSPRLGFRKMEQTSRRKSTPEIRPGQSEDESSTISESSFSTSSQTDTERSKMEDGRSLLERCDKLLNSIAEMASTTSNSTELQPSPVSVLDSSFYKEESSPSPVMKRTIDFKDQVVEPEDEIWSPSSSGRAFQLKSSDTDDNADDQQDPDFTYVSDIIRASTRLPEDSDIFLFLEKKLSLKGKDTSKQSTLQRRLIFDTITEILDRNRQLPPWKLPSHEPDLREVWSELQRIRKRDESDDLFEMICGVMKRDLTRDWGECESELSEAVLDIERLIFKDLIGETIGCFAGKGGLRRRLVF